MDSDKVLVPGALEQEAASIIERCARLIQQGVTCCVSTKRTVLTLPDDTPEAALVRSVAIRDALQSCRSHPRLWWPKAALPAAMWV